MRDHDETFIAPHVEPRAPRRDRAYLIVLAGSNVGEMFKIGSGAMVIGRGSRADIPLLDDGVSRAHAEISVRSGEIVIRDLESRNGTFCNGSRVAAQSLRDGDKIQLGQTTILKFTFGDDLEESFQRKMYDSALRDSLTSVFNKRHFTSQLTIELQFARRHETPLALVVFDLDDLKAVNDRHGHLAGDHVLAEVAESVAGVIRAEDLLARIGGDEFAILCRASSLEDAVGLARRLLAAVESRPIRHGGEAIDVSVSIGVAALPESSAQSADEFLANADRALYRAKQGGRNRLEIDDGEP